MLNNFKENTNNDRTKRKENKIKKRNKSVHGKLYFSSSFIVNSLDVKLFSFDECPGTYLILLNHKERFFFTFI